MSYHKSYRIISYHIISYHIIYHIISYHIIYHIITSHHIISYHIISYIISYHISYHILYYIILAPSIHNTCKRPDVLLQLGYTWRHVSAVKRPSSDQLRMMLLRYSQNCCPMGSHSLH